MSQESLIDAAKAPSIAYNNKDWEAVKAAVTPGFLYDEVATQRKTQGADQVIAAWQGWGTAFPDSKATFPQRLRKRRHRGVGSHMERHPQRSLAGRNASNTSNGQANRDSRVPNP